MKHWESKENRVTIAEVYKSSEGSPLTTSDSVSLVKTFKTTSDDANYASASGTADAECSNRSVGESGRIVTTSSQIIRKKIRITLSA